MPSSDHLIVRSSDRLVPRAGLEPAFGRQARRTPCWIVATVPRAGLEPAFGRQARRTPCWIVATVPRAGLEPARIASLVFETSASTDSATWVGHAPLFRRTSRSSRR